MSLAYLTACIKLYYAPIYQSFAPLSPCGYNDENFGPGCGGLGDIFYEGGNYLMEKGGD